MLNISEIYYKYIDQDPIRIFQAGAVKSAIILFTFLAVTSYFHINKNLIVIGILFIANLAGSVLIGSVQAKKIAFSLYMISVVLIVNISPYVHQVFETNFILIVVVVFAAFWTRRFGEAFIILPAMVVVITCICFIRYPLEINNHMSFTVTALIIGLAFYLLLIRSYRVLKPNEIKKILNEFIKLFVRNYLDTFEKSKYRRFTQREILRVSNLKYQNIDSFKNHGLMFLRKNNYEGWRFLSHNLVVFNRLASKFLLNYKRLSINYIHLGFKNPQEVQKLSENLEGLFKETLLLMSSIPKDSDAFTKQCEVVEYLKYKLEMNYIEKYQSDNQKKKLLFNSILLLDDMFISLNNIREAYYDLV